MKRRDASGIRARLAQRWGPIGPWSTGAPPALLPRGDLVLDAAHHPRVFGPDEHRWLLLTAADEIVKLEPVFWPGDGTGNLYTGSRSLRNYARADTGEWVLAQDEPRVRPAGSLPDPTASCAAQFEPPVPEPVSPVGDTG